MTGCYDCITDDEGEGCFGLCEDAHLRSVPPGEGAEDARRERAVRGLTPTTDCVHVLLGGERGMIASVLLLVVSR